jgi:hypothetical protein
MRLICAKRLHNRDQVEVRVSPSNWKNGMVLGEPNLSPDGKALFAPVMLDDGTYLAEVRHTDLR